MGHTLYSVSDSLFLFYHLHLKIFNEKVKIFGFGIEILTQLKHRKCNKNTLNFLTNMACYLIVG